MYGQMARHPVGVTAVRNELAQVSGVNSFRQ